MKRRLVATLVCLMLATPVWAGIGEGQPVPLLRFVNAVNAYERKDYATALREFRHLAERRHAKAQYNLGIMYANGQGVPQNSAEALKWYRKAAAQGNAGAQNNLGVMYANGKGVPQDFAEALKWYRKAAMQGDAEGQTNLGSIYYHPHGVPKNFAEALKWYRKAAEQGNAGAQNNLGIMYADGHDLPQDDYVQAHMWVSLAASWGFKQAIQNRDKIAKNMTPAQITEAQKLAHEWLAKHQKK